MIAKINTIKATILTIAITITTIIVNYREESVIFVIKKIVTLANIQMMSNRRQKNFGEKTENFMEIKVNITHFWPIIKGIQMIT